MKCSYILIAIALASMEGMDWIVACCFLLAALAMVLFVHLELLLSQETDKRSDAQRIKVSAHCTSTLQFRV